MPGEGPPIDVPPAAGSFGRFRVLHQIGTGSLGPVFRGEDPDTGERVTIKHLQLKIGPERARFIAEDLRALIAQLPAHLALTRIIDAGLHAGDPFVVCSLAAGEPLDTALREYGPAVLDDALPRLERLAEALDLADQAGVWHGALHPRDVMVSARETRITGLGIAMVLERAGVPLDPRPPYAAPESGTAPGSSALDRFALAAMAYEWLFGRPIDGPAETPLTVPQLPGVDGERLSDAFTTALAPLAVGPLPELCGVCRGDPRFLSCVAAATARSGAAVRVRRARRCGGALAVTGGRADRARVATDPGSPSTADFPLDAAVSDPPVGADEPASPAAPPAFVVAPETDKTVRWRGSLSVGEPAAPAPPAGFSFRALVAVLLAGVAIGVIGGYLLAKARQGTGAAATADSSTSIPAAAHRARN